MPTSLAVAFLVGVWSLSWVVMKTSQSACDPLLFGTLACGLGALVTFGGYWLRGRHPRRPPWGFLGWAGVLGVGSFQICAQLALSSGGAGKTILLIYSMPFWATAIAWRVLGEVPRPAEKVGLGLAAVGLLLVVAPWEAAPVAASLWALGSGLSWAAGAVATRRLLQQAGTVTPIEASTWQLAIGTVPLAIAWWLLSSRGLTVTPGLVGALAYNAVLCGVPAWAMWGLVVKRLPMAGAGLVSLLVPMAGVGWAWLFLGERPSGLEGVGMAIILVALVWPMLRTRSATPSAVASSSLVPAHSETEPELS